MNKNKIGTVFLVSILALAGVGVSFAGLSDIITISGSVSTGTVDLVPKTYSGTWVWKVYPHGIDVTNDITVTYPEGEGKLVSWAQGRAWQPS